MKLPRRAILKAARWRSMRRGNRFVRRYAAKNYEKYARRLHMPPLQVAKTRAMTLLHKFNP